VRIVKAQPGTENHAVLPSGPHKYNLEHPQEGKNMQFNHDIDRISIK
jgi:hypothetical protein